MSFFSQQDKGQQATGSSRPEKQFFLEQQSHGVAVLVTAQQSFFLAEFFTGSVVMEFLTILLFGLGLFGEVLAGPACEPTPASENLALKGRASQSSQYQHGGLPFYPLTDKPSGFYIDNTCSHTDADMNPWWKVDLGQSQPIGSVVVMNRADCCPERLNGAEVRVGDNVNNNNPVCGIIRDLSPGSVSTLCCKGMVGRYVSVIIPGRAEWLTVCGVAVYGVVPQKPDPNACW
ncbi:fucolectin-1-like [Lissotriton helveticus]